MPLSEDKTKTDYLAYLEVIEVAEGVQQALQEQGHETRLAVVTRNVLDILQEYDPHEWLVFNLMEGLVGNPEYEIYTQALYEAAGFIYTAGPAITHYNCLHKDRTKRILSAHGIVTPSFQVVSSVAENVSVPLPAIVKPVAEDGSIGIPLNAVASNPKELKERIEFILKNNHQAALVEEFIDGREFYVGIWGNDPVEVLPISEVTFKNIANPLQRISSYATKWEEESELFKATPVVCPAVIEDELAQKIKTAAADAYRTLGCRDYAHADFRLRDGIPYFIEINPACDISNGKGFARQARLAGYSYPQMIERIAEFAWARR